MSASFLRSLRALAAFSLFNYCIVSTFCGDIGMVNIQQGRLMGKVFDTVSKSATFYAFKGIPYAKPPVGALKFMPPEPHPGWEGVRSAFEHGDFCLQADYPSEEGIGSEDCLFLNVYTPTLKHKSLPVMVFIHGGFFREGSGNDTWFGPDYLMDEDVILVTINYRLAVLGFLNLENEKYPGNMGLKDIVLSLKWVKDNIKSFGGDPNKITIFGQGSGGVAVDLLYLSPIAKGLFHRAIMQSGTTLIASYLEWQPRNRAFYLSKIMGHDITGEATLLKLFNEVDPAYLQGNLTRTIKVDETTFKQIGIVVFSPAITTEKEGFITKLPEDILKSGEIPDPTIPIMIGYNSEEGILHNSFYIRRPHFIKMFARRLPHYFPLRGLFAKFDSKYHYEIEYRLLWYYFNETVDPNKPTLLKEFLNYSSDEHIIPIDKSVKEYVKVLKAPVYFYRFSYDGGLNYFKAQETKPIHDKLDQPVAGASEKDELCYLFKCNKLKEQYTGLHSAEEEPNDLKTIRRMVRLWTNFAKTGNPTPNEDDSILGDFKWLPAEEGMQNFLDIDEILECGTDPHGENVEFWDAMYEYYNPLATNGVLIDKPKEKTDENGSISATIPDRPVELKNFVKLCEQRRKFPCLYKLEYQTAVKVDTHSCRHATKKTNLDKNQNQKVIPYDYNRVVLNTIEGQPDSDYINASYIDSLLKPNAYIVTQGPTEFTVTQFWRMVWQERAAAIVMLTKTFDFIKVMCVQYWPPSKDKDENYGGIHIGVAQEEELANFHIRTFRLYKKDAEGKVIEERFLLQFHYTQWHSHTCPFSNAILEFRRRVRAVVGHRLMSTTDAGPMVVHCNDGGGRSGVYLAIDANMELAEEEDSFDVFGYMKKLRQSRKGLIENIDQYKFVYDTLEEHIVCGVSWFPVKELSQCLKLKAQRDPATRLNSYQREYAQICRQTPRFTIGDCAGGHRGDNREKNRDVLVVPPDNFRPYLTSFQGNSFTDYINAVFVDGYTKPREYIVTEWPLKGTCGEFWSLVYDYECAAVVVLCIPPHSSQQFPAFWPDTRHSKKYGPVFTIDHVSHNHYTNIKTWVFRINKKIVSLTELMAGVKAPPKTVQLFQLTCWPMGHKVPTSTNSLVELMNMVERWRQRTDYGPVCVVSPDGRSRAGVYCAANACIEQVIQHGEVDIFQAVKTVRRHRPQLIENMTEYKYCYDLVLHYVLHYLNKDMKEKK